MFDFVKNLFGPGVDLQEKIGQGAIIIDVRTVQEFNGGHVKGAKHIPLNDIDGKIDKIKSWNKPVITCCASGMRSGTAASILKNNGIEAYNGGSWQTVDGIKR